MQPVLLDSSIYIGISRAGQEALDAFKRTLPQVRMWLSAVVLEELYAGASKRDRRPLERLERQFGRVGRILVPNLGDWTRAGQVLAQLAVRHGYERIGKERLTNDALIAMSAARYGITIVTSNERDFARLAQFRPFHYQVLNI